MAPQMLQEPSTLEPQHNMNKYVLLMWSNLYNENLIHVSYNLNSNKMV